MSASSFSTTLRSRTWGDHSESEGSGFMSDLMSGAGSREDYIALVAQHYFIYQALEAVQAFQRENDVAGPFITGDLTRLPALEADLRFLIGDDWQQHITPLPSTVRYVDRINEVGATWSGGFIAHHYTRYLGDLSGGQIIYKVMQRRFGFETEGITFYLFDRISDPRAFKIAYRDRLDAAGFSDDESDRIIDEVILAYRFNTELFNDLAEAKAAAAA